LPPWLMGWVPGDWPKTAHATEQIGYGFLNFLNPLKSVRGISNIRKGGLNRLMGSDVYLTRRQRAGKSGFDIPWYMKGNTGRIYQLAKMLPEVVVSKVMNLNPKNAYLSEVFNIKPLIAREFKRLEKFMATETRGSKEWHRAYNEYLNEAAKAILNLKATEPNSAALKNLEKALTGHIFPTSSTVSFMDIVRNPQILSDLTKSKLPTEMLEHLVPRLEQHTKPGKETIWLTKPLMPVSGAAVRKSSATSKATPEGFHSSMILTMNRAWTSLWDRSPDVRITKEALLSLYFCVLPS